jgi:hypothetical protein
MLLRFLDRSLTAGSGGTDPWISRVQLMLARRFRGAPQISANSSLFDMARVEAEKLIQSDPRLVAVVRRGIEDVADADQIWSEFVGEISDRLLTHIGQHAVERLQHARLFDLFQSGGAFGALYALIAPVFISYSLFAKERAWSRDVWRHFAGDDAPDPIACPPRVAVFTDTFDESNRVAASLRHEHDATRSRRRDLTIVMCTNAERPPSTGVHCVPPLTSCAIPDYPGLALNVPPFLRLLKHCYDVRYTRIHVATPGPMGLAGLAIARILHLRVTGTYHAEFPQYVKALTEDAYVEQLASTAITWFYQQLDAVYAPTQDTAAELVARGLPPARVRVHPADAGAALGDLWRMLLEDGGRPAADRGDLFEYATALASS